MKCTMCRINVLYFNMGLGYIFGKKKHHKPVGIE